MVVEIIDGNRTWTFNTKESGVLKELISVFENIEEAERTVKNINIEFKEGTFISDMQSIFTEMDKEEKIVKQIVTLNEENENS